MHDPNVPPPDYTLPATPQDGTAVVNDDSPASRTALSESAPPVPRDRNIYHWLSVAPDLDVRGVRTIQEALDATSKGISPMVSETRLGQSVIVGRDDEVYEIYLAPVVAKVDKTRARRLIEAELYKATYHVKSMQGCLWVIDNE
jgi:hypothetical protein